LKLVRAHVDTASAEAYAFAFETEALFERGMSAQLDFPLRAQHPMPRETGGVMAEKSRHLARASGETGSPCHGSVSGDFALGNPRDRSTDAQFRGYDSALHRVFRDSHFS
jgi:hypothetical protein